MSHLLLLIFQERVVPNYDITPLGGGTANALTQLLCKIQQIATPTKWGILEPPMYFGRILPPTTDNMLWGSAETPIRGYGVIFP